MGLRESLAAVGTSPYDPRGSRDQAIFDHLDAVAHDLSATVPSMFSLRVSKGVGNLPHGLWVAILDPDVTDTPTDGIYVVFLYNQARTHVTLSLNQGITAAQQRARELGQRPLDYLHTQAADLRSRLPAELTTNRAAHPDLGSADTIRKYAAGSILATTWPLTDLPTNPELAHEVSTYITSYGEAVRRQEAAILSNQAPHAVPPRQLRATQHRATTPPVFQPKNDSDYRAHITAQEQVRTRSHETLVKRLGEHIHTLGLQAATNRHPIDLEITGSTHPIIVEAKIVRPGHPREAVRQAIGQLFEYQHFLRDPHHRLLAAFSEDPGPAYKDLLATLNIGTLWLDAHQWHADPLARTWGLEHHTPHTRAHDLRTRAHQLHLPTTQTPPIPTPEPPTTTPTPRLTR